jgi:Zn-dependent protease
MDFRSGALLFIVLVSSLCIHEWAHAWVAWKLGDDTAHSEGRVTLNPAAHIDILGTIILPLLCIFVLPGGFFLGWAKPVPVNHTRFRNPRFDDFLTTFAGPFSNLLLAVLAAVVGGLAMRADPKFGELVGKMISVNIWLMVFNLLPVPPLDGGRILRVVIGMSWETFAQISRYSLLILVVALNIVPGLSMLLSTIMVMLARPLDLIARMVAGGHP